MLEKEVESSTLEMLQKDVGTSISMPSLPSLRISHWMDRIPWKQSVSGIIGRKDSFFPTSFYALWMKGQIIEICMLKKDFPGSASSREPACHAREVRSIPGSGRSLREGQGNPLHYSCLEDPMDRGAWWSSVHRVAKSQTWLMWASTHTR